MPQRKLPPKRLLRLLKPKKTKKKRLMLPNMLLSKLLPRFQETKKDYQLMRHGPLVTLEEQ